MTSAEDERRVLSSGGVWRATPADYSSLRSLWLEADGTGKLVYGYGQTIYACVRCQWDVVSTGLLRLTYLDSPPFQRFPGYTSSAVTSERELSFTLIEGVVSGVESVVGQPYSFRWTLELSESPWPLEIQLPYTVPRTFFGHGVRGRVSERGRDAADD